MKPDQDATAPVARDIRPSVASGAAGRGTMMFAGVATIGAALLFYTLESHRASSSIAVTSVSHSVPGDMIASPAALQIPDTPQFQDYSIDPRHEGEIGLGRNQKPDWHMRGRSASELLPDLTNGRASAPSFQQPDLSPSAPTSASPGFTGPTLVYGAANVRPGITANDGTSGKQDERVTASRFQNPSTTIPKGAVIQAVLETALDSTRAGFARAIVSRDIFGFDGTELLIPKGSRLVGEYKADLASGQNRALIQWQRLMRPDGVLINLDSPAADPLGRAGVRGKVDSHFLERFSGAILQSALDIGVQLATRSVSRDAVIVALPGSVQGVTAVTPDKIQPTLKVRQGTSVSVFVSRDLDFSTVVQ